MDTDVPRWFKSSHSSFEGGCLEVAFTSSSRFRSRYGSFESGACVEGEFADRPVVLVRDTQNREDVVLDVGVGEWAELLRLLTA
ncbi:hypothetical protein A6A08_11215 [Nocardiopsis sp. TSRI0078]|uniref:DUF397 domain-containing protein n=1 Tax=unclassified Nocardiopsis TaxID=2649073 RepID=UPI00093ACD04|nr:DUF397 domain-containing protein [Nocardiopsis sp. TSRI0078]OKI15092.1 hypothetical protein A6A08_11215 [Nocardiopsis sp. TSRI0078]